MNSNRTRRLVIATAAATAALVAIPAAFVLTMYILAMRTGLAGRRGGPQDAFRHTFTSALVGKTFGTGAVKIVTELCERDPQSPFDQMDIHNNTLGAELGASGNLSATELYNRIRSEVDSAQVGTFEPGKIMHLTPDKWSNGL